MDRTIGAFFTKKQELGQPLNFSVGAEILAIHLDRVMKLYKHVFGSELEEVTIK